MRELNSAKKTDYNQLLAIALMSIIVFGYMFYTSGQREKQAALVTETNQITRPNSSETTNSLEAQETNSISELAPLPKGQLLNLKNEDLSLQISSTGGQVTSVELLKHKAYDLENKSRKPLFLIKENNSSFNLEIPSSTGTINTLNLAFSPQQNGNILTLTAAVESGQIQYLYELKDDNTLTFNIKTTGLNLTKPVILNWKMNAFQLEKGRTQEEYYTEAYFSMNQFDDVDYDGGDFDEPEDTFDWIAFKQQFFISILSSDKGFTQPKGSVTKVEEGEFIKKFDFQAQLEPTNNELNESLNWNFTPMDLDVLTSLGKKFDEIIPFGWSFIGWLNRYVFIHIFKFLSSTGFSYGIVILLMTVVIKILLSPIMYKQHKQSAMMRVLKPEIDEINIKYKDNAMKKQQETMALYSKAGTSPLAGCLPALIQIPIFYSLFRFFPNIIDLRGKSFLWADDLTSYDSIMELPFEIPMYGGHVGLFAILYAIAMFIYTRMTASNISQPTQEGMPDMRKIMMFMPFMFVIFLNQYASGLSWYYLVSNVINIGIVLVIKHFLIDEEKIHQLVQANKAKPKKQGKFTQRFNEVMKQAQEQQEAKKTKK